MQRQQQRWQQQQQQRRLQQEQEEMMCKAKRYHAQTRKQLRLQQPNKQVCRHPLPQYDMDVVSMYIILRIPN